MDERQEFEAFIAGFISGEGSFYITLSKSGDPLPLASCAFAIKLRADDYELLKGIRAVLGYPGNICRISTKRYRYAWDSVQRHDAVMFKVTSIKEHITQIIPFFEQHPLRGMKRRNYDLWREGVQIMFNQNHLTIQGISRLRELRAEMNTYQGQDVDLGPHSDARQRL